MKLLKEIKKEANYIVLIDTNVLINIENKQASVIDLKAIRKNKRKNFFITDLSFCELMVGCRDIIDYDFHIRKIQDMNIKTCGSYEPLCIFLSSFDYGAIKNEKALLGFKGILNKLKDQAVFPLFYSLFDLYTNICMFIFHQEDKEYWQLAYSIFNDITREHENAYYKLIFDCYREFMSDKNESKRIIKTLLNELIINFLCETRPDKYFKKDIEEKLSQLLSTKGFTKLVDIFHLKKCAHDKNWKVKEFIKYTRSMVRNKEFEPIITDGLCFLLFQILFNNANFNSHNLIDLSNICFSVNKTIKIYYFTNDIKNGWKTFIEVEKDLHKEINLYINNQ